MHAEHASVFRYVCHSEAEWIDVTLFPQLRHIIPESNDTTVWMNYDHVKERFRASHYISATSQHINYTCESCNKSLIKNNLKNVCADYCTPLQLTELEYKQLLALQPGPSLSMMYMATTFCFLASR